MKRSVGFAAFSHIVLQDDLLHIPSEGRQDYGPFTVTVNSTTAGVSGRVTVRELIVAMTQVGITG